LIWYGGGRRGRVSPKEKLTEFLVPIRRTRFCENYFLGIWIFAKPRLICFCILSARRKGEKRMLGASQGRSATARGGVAEFSSRKISVTWGMNAGGLLFRRGGNSEKLNPLSCLYHSTIFRPRSKGVHPRHSPRTFPLGLRVPRCPGLALLLAIARLRAGGSSDMLFGGRKESFPQLRLVSAGLYQPAQPNLFLVFISAVCGIAFASDFCIARSRRRSSRPRRTEGIAGGTP